MGFTSSTVLRRRILAYAERMRRSGLETGLSCELEGTVVLPCASDHGILWGNVHLWP